MRMSSASAAVSLGSSGQRDAESLLRTKPMSEIRSVESATRKNIEDKKEELRQLVGTRYRDLIDSADSIVHMKSLCESISANISSIHGNIRSLSSSSEAKTPALAITDPARVNVYGIACRVKYLVDTPENIWGCLDESMFLEAAGRYMRAQHVQQRLVKLEEVDQSKLLANFPLLEHQWQIVEGFKAQISQRSHERLLDPGLGLGDYVDALTAVAVVDELDPKEVLELFLDSRKTWVLQKLNACSGDDAGSVVSVFCDVLSVVQVTVGQVGELFLQALTDMPLFYKTILSTPPASQLFGGIPNPEEEVALWKLFRDNLESVMVIFDKDDISKVCLAWLRECGGKIVGKVSGKRLIEAIVTGAELGSAEKRDSVALYYACLTGRLDAARLLLENGAICSEHTFDGDRCHYASLNLRIRKLLKAFEARPPPLAPLQASLRDTFLGCRHNQAYLKQGSDANSVSVDETGSSSYFPPDVTFFVQGRPVEAHRVILSARSPFFKQKFENEWKDRREVRFSKEKLSYPALCSLIHFFYSDRLEISVDDMEDLVRICKVCKCESLQKIVEKELIHQRYAEYKTHRDLDNSMKRFILQGVALPEEDRLPASLGRILGVDSLADVCVRVDKRSYYCHQVILASRSEYFRARLSRVNDFNEGKNGLPGDSLPFLEEHDLSAEAFEKMIEYMYTDGLKEISPDQAEEIFDVASRYLLFPLKRAVADALLPHLESATPAELCHWLVLSDMYGVLKIREYCLDLVACNFEAFVETREFRAMLLTLPPPSGDSSLRTTVPSAPGATMTTDQGNLLDDLREKWLEAEALELDMRDESALIFDKRLRMLVEMAEQEKSESEAEDNRDTGP